MGRQTFLISVCLTFMLAAAPAARAASITFNLTVEFSGATEPSGSPPWLRATFSDVGGGVELKMDSLLQGPTEFVRSWMFNLDPELDPTELAFAHSAGGPLASSISTGVDAFLADGDGRFDIQFMFSNSGPNRFTAGDSVTYLITHTQPITAHSFNFMSQVGGGQGIFESAAHVQGVDDDFSGWIGTPEPGTALLLLASLGLVAARRRRLA